MKIEDQTAFKHSLLVLLKDFQAIMAVMNGCTGQTYDSATDLNRSLSKVKGRIMISYLKR